MSEDLLVTTFLEMIFFFIFHFLFLRTARLKYGIFVRIKLKYQAFLKVILKTGS